MTPSHPLPDPALQAHTFLAVEGGPRLIVLGGVHGNEPCGTAAARRVAAELETGALALTRGQLTLVPAANPRAALQGTREGERNLNRNFLPKPPSDYEDRLTNLLCPLLARHDVLLDLHSFSAPGAPFSMIGPRDNTGPLEPFGRAAEEERLALRLGPPRIVEGWLAVYAAGAAQRGAGAEAVAFGMGTNEYMRSQGGYGITLECGQHGDPAAAQVAYDAIVRTLATLEMIDRPRPPPCGGPEVLQLTGVVDRQHAGDRFSRAWKSFDAIAAGTEIGRRHEGTAVLAVSDGFIVFPDAAAVPGTEWFYLAGRSDRLFDPA